MLLVGKNRLHEFQQKHADTRTWIDNWVKDTEASIWRTPQDIKRRYPKASFLSENRVFFDIRGNNYRLLTQIAYKTSSVRVIWLGTHQEYDKLAIK